MPSLRCGNTEIELGLGEDDDFNLNTLGLRCFWSARRGVM